MAPYPVDWIVAVYNAALVPVWLGLAPKSAAAPWLALAHGVAALLPFLLRRIRSVPPKGRAVFVLYPVVALALFWSELGTLQSLRAAPPLDEVVRRLDLAVFGTHWHEVWMGAMPQAWMSELMHFGYFLYYPVLVVPPLVILAVRGHEAFRSVALAVMVTYLSCFLFYLAVPVYGPRAMTEGSLPPGTVGFFQALVEGARERGDSPGTAFPSSHVAGAVTIAWMGWRWLPRAWGLVLSASAAMVALATVYTRNHYAVDALAGLLWALALQGWLVPRLERGTAKREPTEAAVGSAT